MEIWKTNRTFWIKATFTKTSATKFKISKNSIIHLTLVSIVVFYGAYYVFKKWRAGEDVAFLRPGKFDIFFKGDTDKQALKLICQRFFNFQPIILNFSANASFLRPFEWRNQIWPNTAAQRTFCTAQRTFCTVFQSFLFFKVESWFLVCCTEFRFRKHSYTLFFDTVHILHCTAHILHHFHNFFVFQAREL